MPQMLIKDEMHYGLQENLIPEESITVIYPREKIISYLFSSNDSSQVCITHKYENTVKPTYKQKSVLLEENSSSLHGYKSQYLL